MSHPHQPFNTSWVLLLKVNKTEILLMTGEEAKLYFPLHLVIGESLLPLIIAAAVKDNSPRIPKCDQLLLPIYSSA